MRLAHGSIALCSAISEALSELDDNALLPDVCRTIIQTANYEYPEAHDVCVCCAAYSLGVTPHDLAVLCWALRPRELSRFLDSCNPVRHLICGVGLASLAYALRNAADDDENPLAALGEGSGHLRSAMVIMAFVADRIADRIADEWSIDEIPTHRIYAVNHDHDATIQQWVDEDEPLLRSARALIAAAAPSQYADALAQMSMMHGGAFIEGLNTMASAIETMSGEAGFRAAEFIRDQTGASDIAPEGERLAQLIEGISEDMDVGSVDIALVTAVREFLSLVMENASGTLNDWRFACQQGLGEPHLLD